MVAALPDTLGRHLTAPGSGRRPTTIEPLEPDPLLVEPLDRILDVDAPGSLPSRSDSELGQIRVGAQRSKPISPPGAGRSSNGSTHSRPRSRGRYRTGEASVESLLQ